MAWGRTNHDGTSRWAYALGYARWFIKPSFDYMRNTPSEIYNALDDNQKKLMGFYNVPPKRRIYSSEKNFSNP